MVSGKRTRTQVLTASATVVLLLLVCGQALASDHRGQGQGKFKVNPLTEVQVTDGTISSFTATPTSLDPGPRAFSNSDGFRFNTRYTNTKSVFFLDVSAATTGGGWSSLMVQGVSHPVAEWVFARQGGSSRFVTVSTTGVYDADAAAYLAPGGFTRSSQGTATLRSYDQTTPADGGSAHTLNWIYDASTNLFYFDATDKDFTNGNGEVRVAPISKASASRYSFTVQTNQYGVSAVAAAGANYVPTLNIGWVSNPSTSGGKDLDVYVLLDFPSGAPSDTYSYTIQGTIHDTI